MEVIRALFFKRSEDTTSEATLNDQLLRAYLSGDTMTRQKAQEIPAVEGCVNLIATTVSNIPIKLYKKSDNGSIEVINDNRVEKLNNETGDIMNASDIKKALIYDYFLNGNGYVYVDKKGLSVDGLYYVSADNVSTLTGVDPIFKVGTLAINGKDYNPVDFIIMARNTVNGISGASITKQHKTLLSSAYNTMVFEENLVRTGGNKKGFLKSSKRLSQDAINVLKNAWRNLYSNSSENVIVLNDGLEFQDASSTSVEMQLNESKSASTVDICKIFNVPPAMLTGNATDQDERNFIKYCVIPLMNQLVREINKVMLLETEKGTYYFGADTDDVYKGDIEKRFNAYRVANETGWMQIDEIREKENMSPLGMDYVKLGLADVLYNPKTKEIYTPNTNQTTLLTEGGKTVGQE